MSTTWYTFAVTWYFLRVNVGRQTVLKIQCIVRHHVFVCIILSDILRNVSCRSSLNPRSCLEAGNTCQHVWRTPLEALSAPTLAWPLRRPVNTSGPSRQVRHAAGGTAGSSLTSRSEALQQHFYWRDNYKGTDRTNTNVLKHVRKQLAPLLLIGWSQWLTDGSSDNKPSILSNTPAAGRRSQYWPSHQILMASVFGDLWTRLNDQLLLFLNCFLHL